MGNHRNKLASASRAYRVLFATLVKWLSGFFEVGFDGEGVAALVPGRIVVLRSGSGLSEEPAFGV
jgi:hypothetical protein